MAYPLEITGLVKRYGSIVAVNDVSFAIEPGEVFGLLGPNGAGKTTIISILTTLETPTEGTARIFGYDVSKGNRNAKSLLGVVPQEIVSHGFFTVEEVLHFHSGYYGIRNNYEQIEYLLTRLGLSEHRKKRVRQLSGGMKRRLLIAKALVHKPKLLLLDEPTAGVDIELRSSLWGFVRELNQQGVSILLTTHYLEEAEKLCQRVGILHLGRLLQIGQTAELVKKLTLREFTVILDEPIELTHPYLKAKDGKRLVFRVPSDFSFGELIAKSGIPLNTLRDVRIKEGTLEEAFMHIVREGP